MATATSRQQPPWQPPPDPSPTASLPPLKIWNSLTRSKTPFVPLDWKNKRVTWYACGPTVYDDSHLGHARNYVSTDIIRRILRDYFTYNVQFVMNITDVDDKIIVRGRQRYLLEQFKQKRLMIAENQIEARLAALEAYIAKNLREIPKETPPQEVSAAAQKRYEAVLKGGSLDGSVPGDKEAKLKMHIRTVSAASDAIVALSQQQEASGDYEASLDDVLGPWLDGRLGASIDSKDHSIFTKLTKKYEDRFMEDVRALNCLDPDEVTRVTEYGPQIVEFVEKIEKNGFAYESENSVYFDIAAFENAKNNYARLEPWNRNDTVLLADAEGTLTKSASSNKHSPADFALWKSSKPGEPSWPSPWGDGRPGWHIECSAMASDKLGRQIDIHSGGIDLAFPHHDNELAQSEAYWLDSDCQHQHQWVNYFMHMGHLSIAGSKMSKSLKNFTTIRDALGRGDWTPRGLRIIFLLGGWREGIEITEDLVKAGSAWEDKLNNFFIKANDVLQSSPQANGTTGERSSSTLNDALEKAQSSTFAALCDSFNTPAAMANMSELISSCNAAEKDQAHPEVVLRIAEWITSMVNIFGLNGTATPDAKTIGWSGLDIPEEARETLSTLSSIRDDLRRRARSPNSLTTAGLDHVLHTSQATLEARPTKSGSFNDVLQKFRDDVRSIDSSNSVSKKVLQLCDRVRDVDLWDRGIYLEDRDDNQPALIRLVTKELRAAKESKEERERQKQNAKSERSRENALKTEKGRLSHLDMFKTDDYSEWDAEGLPIKDKAGEELTKSRAKKLRKDWERQKKLHEAWLRSDGGA